MKSKRRFIPLVFLGAIILSLLVIVPAFSATDGKVRFYDVSDTEDDQEWARQGGEVALEVEDDDLDVVNKLTGSSAESIDLNNLQTFFLSNVPVADRNDDGFVNARDVTVVDATDNALQVNRASEDGRVDLQSPHTGTVRVSYWGASIDDTGDTVTVKSQADPTGFIVMLEETRANTGVFRLVINTSVNNSNVDSTPPTLKVGKDDQITLTYKDADPKRTTSKLLKVESAAPVFSELSPANAAAGRANPEVEFNVTDGGSGVGEDEDDDIVVIFGIDNNGDSTIDIEEEYTVNDRGSLNEIDGGFHGRQRLPSSSAAEDDSTVYWWARALDAAGNEAVTDRKAEIKVNDKDTKDPCTVSAFPRFSLVGVNVDNTQSIGGCQPYSIKIDNTEPAISAVRTGAFWDTSNKDDDDKTNDDPAKAKANMILVMFNESLDASTVSSSDFEVNDQEPTKAEVFSGAKSNVFLTLGSDLDPNARPKVELVGRVEDLAGNRRSTAKVDNATDGIAPTLSVSVEGGNRSVTNDEIKILISSNEDIGTPNVAFQRVVDSGLGDDDETEGVDESMNALGSAANVAAVLKSARNYEATYTAPESGLYNVYVTASDATAGNTGKAGVNKGPIDLTDDTKAILFEFDNEVGEPMVMPDDETGSDNSDPFITIDFAAEGKEYPDDAGVDVDSHGTVTIVSATLKSPDTDAMDIAGSLATTDNVIFLYKASDLAKGNHKVTVKATDDAGNEEEFENTVKIVEREPFSLKLKPGWNLVSLPGTPTNTSINAVIPADHPANTILSYDAEGGWMTAIRSEDGIWLGTLMTVDSTRAYWIQTDSFEAIKVDIPRISAGTSVPPTISLMAGWNFVPVVDVSGSLNHGDAVSASAYFSGTKVNRVYSFNTLQGMWEVVDIGADAEKNNTLMVGSGYWAHASEDGVLAP